MAPMKTPRVPFLLFLLPATLVAAAAQVNDHEGSSAFLPMALPLLLIVILRWLGKQAYFRVRGQHRAAPPRPGQRAKSTSSFDGYFEFEKDQRAAHQKAVKDQGAYYWTSIEMATLAPLALLLLALQLLFFPEPEKGNASPWAAGLIIAELALLGLLIFRSWSHLQPSHHWLSSRVRSELLRREKYLHCCRAGSYYGLTAASLEDCAKQRFHAITDPHTDLTKLLIEETITAANQAAQVTTRSLASPPDLDERIHTYLDRRLDAQREWFDRSAHQAGKQMQLLETALKAATLLALLATVLHLVGLQLGKHMPAWVALGCIVLPPVGTFTTTIVHFLALERRARAYTFRQRLLNAWHPRFERLLAQARQYRRERDQTNQTTLYSEAAILVAAVEQELLAELHEFALMREKHHYEAEP